MTQTRFRVLSVASWLATVAAMVSYVLFQIPQLSGFSFGWDEGYYLQSGWLVAQGYRPHSELFFAQVPGFAWSLGFLYLLVGHSVEGFRWAMVLAGAVSLFAVAWIATKNVGLLAGPTAAWVLALNPKFQDLSRTIEADNLALPLMLLAVLSLVHWGRTRRITWALIAGALLGLGAQMKLTAAVLVPGMLAGVLFLRDLKAAAGLIAAFAFVFGLLLAVSSPYDALSQFLLFQARGMSIYGLDLTANLKQISSFLWVDRGLVLLSAGGLTLGARRQFTFVAIWGWILLLATFLVFKSPLYDHNLIVLLPGLALAAGYGVQRLSAQQLLRAAGRFNRSSVVIAALTTVYIVLVPRIVSIDLARQSVDPAYFQAVDFLSRAVPRGSWVVSDDPMVAFRAGLPVVPWLADTSSFRLATGELTAEELVQETRRANVKAVIAWDRFQRHVPQYLSWLEEHFDRAWSQGNHTIFEHSDDGDSP